MCVSACVQIEPHENVMVCVRTPALTVHFDFHFGVDDLGALNHSVAKKKKKTCSDVTFLKCSDLRGKQSRILWSVRFGV